MTDEQRRYPAKAARRRAVALDSAPNIVAPLARAVQPAPRTAPRQHPLERDRGACAPVSQGLGTIRKRADFLAANSGRRTTTPGFVLLVRDREDRDPAMRVGFTVTRKIGGAVVRNRMKRRFRALARDVLPAMGFAGADHVMIGRARGIERDFQQMHAELASALERLRAQ